MNYFVFIIEDYVPTQELQEIGSKKIVVFTTDNSIRDPTET